MTDISSLSDSQLSVLDRIKKLQQLAGRNSSEAEAASALAKMNELLLRHNLDLATVESARPEDGRREQALVAGGFYAYQRELWGAVARLNFCLHWVGATRVERRSSRKDWSGEYRTETRQVWTSQHKVVGRVVNARTTISMAQYLEAVAERIVRDRIAGTETARSSNWAVSFRRGVVARIVEKVEERRDGVIKEEAARQRKAKHAAARVGVSTARTLTVSAYQAAEHDANVDFVYGDGTSAQWAQERAAAAAERKRERDQYTWWARKHPEEAAAKEAEAQRTRRRLSGRTARDDLDHGAYYSGYDAAEDVSIDRQVDGARVAGRLR